ncbi:MAG TPA: ATP-binding protein [Edaphobacter sp.]|nr:ATP-binding protein [Edaphobacter sp.]
MPRLFLKIFLWFWITVIVTGVSLVLAFLLQPRSVPARWHAGFADTATYFGTAASNAFDQGGAPAAAKYLHQLLEDTHIHACLFDHNGRPLAGEHCPQFAGMIAHVIDGAPMTSDMRHGLARIAVRIRRPYGSPYIYASELLAGPRAAFGINPGVVLLRAAVALIVSGLICYFLTLYLTTPILRLRSVAQRITAGQLSVRARPELESRTDELGSLAKDFNRMADRTEDLISSQRQLLYDVSHELRSPLSRMNVALDLLRGRHGGDPAITRIETDLHRLNELIGRLLTVAKLEATSTLAKPAPIELSSLVASVAGDADFEAKERGSRVEIVHTTEVTILGDASLMRSAIENVVRNAIRFTRPNTAVEISLVISSAAEVMLVIRDYGPGVPEDQINEIFKPFYRASSPQDSDSGGAGLGLAITQRIVLLHGGHVRATNDPKGGGLRVEITLPVTPTIAAAT